VGVYTFISSMAGKVGRAEDMGSDKVDGGPPGAFAKEKMRRESEDIKAFVLWVGGEREKIMGKIHFTPLKFQWVFNLNPKVLKLVVYPLKFQKVAK
jgi:hypothetical protein